MKALLLVPLIGWSVAAAAHEIHSAVAPAGAVAVALRYADGQPFAYEKYELTPEGQQVPLQVGNTDAAGHVVFLPGDHRRWRLKAYSADGHGVDLHFESPPVDSPAAVAATDTPDRTTRVLIGLAVLFGLFGLFQLFRGQRRP